MIDFKYQAFLSYARFNDVCDEGQISELRKRLSSEVRALSSKELYIFQDKNDIRVGQDWQKIIFKALDKATFFIAILTPSFFNSKYCRQELKYFLSKKNEQNKEAIILPIYYITCTTLENKNMYPKDEISEIISSKQIFDWREYRFEAFTSSNMRRKISTLAAHIVETLQELDGL